MFRRFGWMLLLLAVVSMPSLVLARGGSGGGGGGGGSVELRVTGYITAIDYENGAIMVGQSYYGSGLVLIDSNTKISIDNINADFLELEVGDWSEVRYDPYTRVANKVSVTR